MIESLDPSAERFLVDLNRIQKSINSATQVISSGYRVNRPSDAPDEISIILQLHAELERSRQIQANLKQVHSEVATAQSTLETVVRIVDRARVLASQGAGTMQSGETRTTLAAEVQGLLEQVVAASRTIVQGRYIFGGDADQNPPYELNLANANGVERLSAAAATRLIQHPSGGSFTVGMSAQDIFDHRNSDDTLASDNVFAALNQLRVALESDDQAGIDASLAALRGAGDRLNYALSRYGLTQQKIEQALEFASGLDLRLKQELSDRRDADLVEAALHLERARNHQDAALAARSLLPTTSLFDFLG